MFIGILFIVLGSFMMFLSLKGQVYSKRNAMAASSYFLLFGILVSFASYTENERMLLFVMCFGLGLIFIFVGLWYIKKSISYPHKIEAVYIGSAPAGNRMLAPQFAYQFDGKRYKQSEGRAYYRSYINKHFTLQQTYPIYLSDKNPSHFTTSKKVRAFDVVMVLFGLAIVSMPFLL